MNTDDTTQPDAPLFRTLITEAVFPTTDLSPEQYIQRATVLIRRLLELTISLHTVLTKEAPVLLNGSIAGPLIVTLGYTLQHFEQSATDWMASHDITPLDLRTEEVRVAQHELDTVTDIPANMREQLEQIVAGVDGDETDWTNIVIPGSGEVH